MGAGDDRRLRLFDDTGEEVADRDGVRLVEPGARLVGEQERGCGYEGARDRYALALPIESRSTRCSASSASPTDASVSSAFPSAN